MPVRVFHVAEDGNLVDPPFVAARTTDLIDVGAGVLVRRRVACRYSPDEAETDPPFDITIVACYSDEIGRYEVERIEVIRANGGPPVTSHEMRSIPVAGLLRGLSHHAVAGLATGPHSFEPGPELPGKELPRKIDDDAYRRIAIVHRMHEVFGNRATQELADHFDVSRSTAYNWLKEIQRRRIDGPVWHQKSDHPKTGESTK